MNIRRTVPRLVSVVALWAFGPLLFGLTSPQRLPLIVMVVPFLWLFTAIFVTIWLIAGRVGSFAQRRKRLLIAGLTAALPTMLLVLSSINQLSAKDVILAGCIIVLSLFYLSRASFVR